MKRRLLLAATAALALAVSAAAQERPPYRNRSLPVEQRVSDLLGRMTLEEKATLLSGSGWMESAPIPRLGIPEIRMADGPMGIRNWAGSSAITNSAPSQRQFSSTAFPAGIAIAASWDPALAQAEGQVIGEEMRAVGRDMILGPTVNIQRTPLWGRNFEGYGEDPYLSGQIAVGYIHGIQSEHVIATVKHFVANNEEYERHRIDVIVSERALHEIYFPAFKAAVQQGDVWSVMSAYNLVNGVHCAESPLIHKVLENQWGFKNFVVSDWGSTYSTAATVNAGMDLEMPGGAPMQHWIAEKGPQADGNGAGFLTADKVIPLVKSGAIPMANLNDDVGRILRTLFVSGIFDDPPQPSGDIDTPAQRAVARKAADEGIALLKNQGDILPLDLNRIHSIALIGPNAAVARTGGGGSSLVHAKDLISPLQAMQELARAQKVTYAEGVAMPASDNAQPDAAARQKSIAEAVAAAKNADVAVVFVGYSPNFESEGFDRKDMDLPAGQDDLVKAVVAANPKTIVVLNAGDPVNVTRWIDKVPAFVDAFYGGEETGYGIADVLVGNVDPAGKLPFTFIRELKDSPSYGHYPGHDLKVDYAEGIYVGYRYFDRHPEIRPLFPFGYGLSYTSFGYSHLQMEKSYSGDGKFDVSFDLKNTGHRAGAEVVQLYVGEPHPKIDRQVKELKAFRRVVLTPGETTHVTLQLDRSDLSYWDPQSHRWTADPGQFDVYVAASDTDVRLRGSFELTGSAR